MDIQIKATSLSLKEFIKSNKHALVFLFLLICIVYFNSIGNGFVSDDLASITENPNVATLHGVFSSPLGFLQRGIYFLDAFIFGLNPSVFRITSNLFFHIANTFLVFLLLSLISRRKTLAIFASGFFAVHPAISEPVVWISGAPYVQATFFALLSLIAYIFFRDAENWKKYLPFAFIIIAVLSHPMMIVIPLLIALYEIVSERKGIKLKRLAPYLLIFVVIGAGFATMLFQRANGRLAASVQHSIAGRYSNPIVQIPTALSTYVKLFVWPAKLTFIPDFYESYWQASGWEYIAYLSFFAILIVFIWLSWKKNRVIFFWLLFFLIALVPTLLPVRITWLVAQRYVYFASIGIFAIIAVFFDWILKKYPARRNSVYIFFAILIIAFSVRTIVRNRDWKNEDTLFLSRVKSSPSTYLVYNEWGKAHNRQGRVEKAADEFKKSIEANSNFADAHYNLALIYSGASQTNLAEQEFEKFIALNPYFAPAYFKLAILYQSDNKIDLAISRYEACVKADPKLWRASLNLGNLYLETGDYQKAMEVTQKALDLNPERVELENILRIIECKVYTSSDEDE